MDRVGVVGFVAVGGRFGDGFQFHVDAIHVVFVTIPGVGRIGYKIGVGSNEWSRIEPCQDILDLAVDQTVVVEGGFVVITWLVVVPVGAVVGQN